MRKITLIVLFMFISLNICWADEYKYICPVCKRTSTYPEIPKNLFGSNLTADHREIDTINAWTKDASFALDEKSLCSFCSPDIALNERAVDLVVQYPDGEV